ncbi:hypothetical protein DY940_34680, partial [Pseudomonas aeruginosa]
MMISCSPIGSDPVCYLYLLEPVQTHASSSLSPWLAAAVARSCYYVHRLRRRRVDARRVALRSQ